MLTLEQRFWNMVNKDGQCWRWTGHLNRCGFGAIHSSDRTTVYLSHRLSWRLHYGEVPPGKCVYQTCRNCYCVNPEHLYLGGAKDVPDEEVFGKRIQKVESGCWLWTGALDKHGYGKLHHNKYHPKRLAHRLSWQLHKGPIPHGLCVLHKCDVRNCVNPEHLFLGTNADNSDDMVSKGRQAKGERHGTAKMDWQKVGAIRVAYKNGATLMQLGEQYGIHYSTVSDIVNYKNWIP